MDEKSLEMLEFPKAREILARFTSFSASQHLALNLRPSSDPALISQLLSQSAEARHLLSLEPDFSIGGSVDIRGDVEMATRGKVLDPQVLLTVEATLAIIRRVRAGIQKHSDEFPLLWSIAENIVELPHIEEEIKRSISPTGELLDSASTELAALRSQSKETNQQLLEHLEYIIHSPQAQRLLQDSFISEREGRYVIPIRIELRKEMKGIVHDVSNTGATAFVEPWSTVEMGNELRQLTIEEKREIERILTAISAEIWAYEAEISHNVELLAEIDLALAKARYAARVNATEPTIDLASRSKPGKQSPGAGALRLINARHPLLGDKAVPLTVELGNDYSILIITGPNTGGKTVALKTIGLLTLMTHAGIPIPAAAESCIPILDGVFADIGDEQSIEQTLSSFSWHMGNIVHILRSATERSLVLLDELGTSTNPGEGAALARAILLDFLARGNIVVATTHFSELKMFAHTTPGLRNASLDFDPVTLMPTYHLTMGVPGGSNALAIATQLGLPPEIITAAREMLSKGSADVEIMLADLTSEKQRIENLRSVLEKDTDEAQRLRSQLEHELQTLREQKETMLRHERDKLADEAAELHREAQHAASELKKKRSQENLEQAERALATMRERITELSSSIKASHSSVTGEPGEASHIKVGDKVWLTDINTWGTVLSIREDEGQIEVQVGHTRLSMGLHDAEKIKPPPGKVLPKPPAVKQTVTRATSLELDLRGRRADEVVLKLDRYLNEASLARFSRVRIIHGFGTGTVRQIVRDMLASHPLVKSFRSGEQGEGGDGVTMVNL